MKKKLVVFDLDGVIVDSSSLVNAYFMNMYPTMTQEKMMELLSGNFHEEFDKFKQTNAPIEETEEEAAVRKAAYTAKKMTTPLFAGIKELLLKLHEAGYKIAINSSAFERNCLPILEHAGVKDLFDFIATAEVSKSKVEKFKIIEEKFGVSKDETIFITDTVGDIKEAEAAGVPTIAVTWGAHNAEYFKKGGHKNLIQIVDTVSDLEKYISE